MKGALGRGKEVLLRRQYQRNLEKHLDRLRQIKPNSTGWEWISGQPTLNHEKKHRMLEDKITEIQRENRHLLQRITHTINKKHQKDSDINKMNKSLNYSFRKKQTESIDSENSKFLKRLQDKKSKYQAQKLKQEWKRQKEVIKNIANFPFIIKDGSRRPRRRTMSKEMQASLATERKKLKSVFQFMRIKNLDGTNLIINCKMDDKRLIIYANDSHDSSLRVIQIPRQEALQFIEKQCDGKLQNLMDHLRYDPQRDVLQLRSRQSYRGIKNDAGIQAKQSKFLTENMQNI